MRLPKSLSNWFLAHFVIDILFAIPLFLFPEHLLTFFGFTVIDPLMARLVAAALFGIGITSFLMHKGKKETYLAMLKLKLIWSSFAIIALLWALLTLQLWSIYLILGIFVIFWLVWLHYFRKLS